MRWKIIVVNTMPRVITQYILRTKYYIHDQQQLHVIYIQKISFWLNSIKHIILLH